MELRIINTRGTAPYGINEIMHAEPVRSLNHAAERYEAWCYEHLTDGQYVPLGVVVDENGNVYSAVSGELMPD